MQAPIAITLQLNRPEHAQQILKLLSELTASAPNHEAAPLSAEAVVKTKSARIPKPQTQATDTSAPSATDKTVPAPTLETVRAKLAAISQAGKTEQVKQLLKGFGVDRLTALAPEDFAELLAQAETL